MPIVRELKISQDAVHKWIGNLDAFLTKWNKDESYVFKHDQVSVQLGMTEPMFRKLKGSREFFCNSDGTPAFDTATVRASLAEILKQSLELKNEEEKLQNTSPLELKKFQEIKKAAIKSAKQIYCDAILHAADAAKTENLPDLERMLLRELTARDSFIDKVLDFQFG